jgi:FkbM family methyltransferase
VKAGRFGVSGFFCYHVDAVHQGFCMIDIGYKLRRIILLSRLMGFSNAIKFELAWSLKQPQVQVKLPQYPTPFEIRRNESDYSVFSTIFLDRELDEFLPPSPQLIIDGGANVGYSTAYYANRYPQAKIIAIEPSSENCRRIRQHCAAFENVTSIEGGLWNESGFLHIANPEDPAWAYRCELVDRPAADTFPAFTMAQVIASSGKARCDLLKLDIEGAEEQLFTSGDWVDRVDAVLVEVHSDAALAAIKAKSAGFNSSYCGEKLLLVRQERSLAESFN